MVALPHDHLPDSTLPFLRDPYRFISRRCATLKSSYFETRLLLQKTICMMGAEAARLFYDSSRFQREHAMPGLIQQTLIGQGGVQGLDDEAHLHRKHLLLAVLTPEKIGVLTDLVLDDWRTAARYWSGQEEVVLYDEIRPILCRAVCTWAGVPLPEADVAQRTDDLTALFQHAGTVGLPHFWSRRARRRSEPWLSELVEAVRSGGLIPPEGSALDVIARHRDLDGSLLDTRIAAVELLNILRPTVAVAVFITFAAHALAQYVDRALYQQLAAGESGYVHCFVQEVRRYYPFFPAAVARVRHDFAHEGGTFKRGTRVLLDLYGTNHDPTLWDQPEVFDPQRFREHAPGPFWFIPQGGGELTQSHRCAGEDLTIRLMETAVEFLTRELSYQVPAQNLAVDYTRLPGLPVSHLRLTGVRLKEPVRVWDAAP